jgi:hypothetical protein
MDTRISRLYSTSSFISNHPNPVQLGGDLYSSDAHTRAVFELVKRQTYHGRYKTSANSLVFGGTSSFYIQPGTIVNQVYLVARVTYPQWTRAPDLWLLNAIDRLEIQVGGASSIQSLQLNGVQHFMAVMAMSSSDKRNALSLACPYIDGTVAGGTQTVAIPIVLPWSSPELEGAFALDTSTLNSQIVVNIRWKQSFNVFSGQTGHAITVPAAFDELYMRLNQVELLDSSFAMRNELVSDPNAHYGVPALYLQSFEAKKTFTAATETMVDLSSIPSGMLQAIVVGVTTDGWQGSFGTLTWINPFPVLLSTMRLLFNGQELFRFDYENEGALVEILKDNQGNGRYYYSNFISAAANPFSTAGGLFYGTNYIIPFSNEISQVLRGQKHENTPSFSGSTLQLGLTVAANQPYSTSYIAGGVVANTLAGAGYTVNILYIFNSVIDITSRNVALDM